MKLSNCTAARLLCILLAFMLLTGCAASNATSDPLSDTVPAPQPDTAPAPAPVEEIPEPDESVIAKDAYNGSDIEEFTLDEIVKTIDEGAFANCTNLKSFHCTSRELSIHENAFSGSENVVFYCYLDSSVDLFAREQGFPCIYYDAFSVQCDTVNNGCVGLPITWTAVDVMPGQEIESEFVYTVFLNDEPVFTSEPTAEQSFSYTPTEGGAYSATVQMSNELTEDSRTCEAVPVAEQLIMGYYEQDDDPAATEPIAWKILTVEDGKAFVISEDILDKGSYFNPEWIKYKYTYWARSCIVENRNFNYWGSMPEDPSRLMTGLTEDSVPLEWFGERGPETDLFYLHARFWCNDTFYNGAFSDEEKARILLTNNVNHDNLVYNIDGGPDSEDYVFFLSHEELDAYLPTNEDRMANYSTYAENIPLEYGTPGLYYWLRTPGRGRYNAMYVHGGAGVADTYGADVGHNNVGYRPAMWITVGG